MNQQKTGKFLKCLRKDKGLTQEQLAEHFYVSPRTVSRWENGNNIFGNSSMEKGRTGIWIKKQKKQY